MAMHIKPITAEQELLIQYLISGMSYTDAAKALDVSTKTVNRWLELPLVAIAYQEAKNHIVDYIKTQVEQLAPKAITALEESLDSTTPQVRLRASQMVLDRIAPITKPSEEVQPVEPQHGLYIANYDYATQEELENIQSIQDAINARKEEAEQGKIVQIRRTG